MSQARLEQAARKPGSAPGRRAVIPCGAPSGGATFQMPGKSHSAKPADTKSLRVYRSLREAFNLVGTEVFGAEWQGLEADCDPARAKQQTDIKSYRRPLATDGQSFDFDAPLLPEPTRPIDGEHGAKLEQAIERHTKALKELLRLLHSGLVPTAFIPENETTARDTINPSLWPDPAKFNPRKPSWGGLRFDIAADRVVLKSRRDSAIHDRAGGESSLWWAYGGRAGHVEIDRTTLEEASKQYVRSKKNEDSNAKTTARNTKIQAAAEGIWREASEEDDRLTKEKVANRLLARSDAGTSCRDLKKRDGGALSQDSLVRLIAVPKWLSKRSSRKKDNQSNATQDNNTL